MLFLPLSILTFVTSSIRPAEDAVSELSTLLMGLNYVMYVCVEVVGDDVSLVSSSTGKASVISLFLVVVIKLTLVGAAV